MCVWLQVINKDKFIHQGEGQGKISTSLQILCSPCSMQAVGLHSTEMRSCGKYKLYLTPLISDVDRQKTMPTLFPPVVKY